MATIGSSTWFAENFGPACMVEMVPVGFCGHKVSVNRKCARMYRRLNLIFQNKAPKYAQKIASTPDTGTYNCRYIANTTVWSNHAYAVALDARWNANARNGQTAEQSEMWREAKPAVLQAEKEGFRWGGRYSSPDPMHFEPLLTPQQIRRRYFVTGHRKPWFKKKTD